MDLPYEVNKPTSPDSNFVAQLTHIKNGAKIKFEDLSSGEKTLFSLAIALYQNENNFEFPEVLLLDEPDAHLHPKMASKLLDTLIKEIAPKLRGGIILTTHSPTTCALAQIGSLHLMDSSNRKPVPTSLDQALEALCVDLPILSIRKEDERQIFVESNEDSDIYSKIWLTLKNSPHVIKKQINLNFLSSGKNTNDEGNCNQAIELCKKLRGGGSKTAYAIIDYDGKNKISSPIEVLGENIGYSIENFILTPLAILVLLFHRHVDSNKMPSFASNFNSRTVIDINQSDAQTLSDAFCEHLKSEIEKRSNSDKVDLTKTTTIKLNLLEGISLDLPYWFLLSQGHAIEGEIIKTFPELKHYASSNDGLMRNVVTHVLTQNINILPRPLVDTLNAVLK